MSNETSPLLESAVQQDYSTSAQSGSGDHDGQTRTSHVFLILPLAIGIFLTAMDQTLVVSTYTSIGSELNQLQNTSWIATSYLLTITSFQPLYGKLSDIFGRKSCLLFAYTVFGFGCLLCGLSRNLTELVVSRAIAGIGGGGMQTLTSIIVSDIVPLRSRGTWQGILNIIWASGNSVGASLGGYLSDTIGWRWAFLIQMPMALTAITAVTFALHLPETKVDDFWSKLRRVDFGGAVTLVLAVVSLLLAMDRGGNISWNDKGALASLAASTTFFFIFAYIEMELAKEPFAPKRIIANRSLIASYLVNLFGIASGFCLLFHIPLILQAVQGKSASETGLWLLIGVFGSVTGSLGGGLIMQATGKFYAITVLGFAALLIGTTIVTLMSGVFILWTSGIAFGVLVSSVGNGSGITTSLISLIANAGPEDQAIATAVSYLFRSFGSVIGVSVGSTLVQGALRSSLKEKLTGVDVEKIIQKVRESLKYLDDLDPQTRFLVRQSYADAIHVALWFSVILATFAFISSLFIKEKPLENRS